MIARAVAASLATLVLLNVIAAVRHPAFDENLLWIDLRMFPAWAEHIALAAAALAMLWWAVAPSSRPARRAAATTFGALALASSVDTVRYYRLWAAERIHPGQPIPLSLVLVVLFLLLAVAATRPHRPMRPLATLATLSAGVVAFGLVMPLAQIAFFGSTDYRAPADAAVVFCARVLPDGTASIALADRVRTGVELYRSGLVRTLVMTGGVEAETGYDESAVMAGFAEDLGVPSTAIIRDALGSSTQASVRSTSEIFRDSGFDRVLAVSHSYHLPRIKLAYSRAGLDVRTVPALATPIAQAHRNAAREIPALWLYYLRAVLT